MSIITISRDSYSRSKEVAALVEEFPTAKVVAKDRELFVI
jgi:hypothetical protein